MCNFLFTGSFLIFYLNRKNIDDFGFFFETCVWRALFFRKSCWHMYDCLVFILFVMLLCFII
uniref:Uncharacterized protein n=1 Tax=Brugia malayi TaxID=6279 RepID=A8QE14_BRUMA